MKLDPSKPPNRKGSARARGTAAPADSDMKEKYFHSLGALFLDEGSLDQAVDAFLSALALKETAYTHYDLGRAYLARSNLDDAIPELSRAIEMCPSAPEYWYERGLAYRRLGEYDRASADLAEAQRIDPDYGRIDEIKSAVWSIEYGLCDPSMEEFCSAAAPRDPELRSIIDGIGESLRLGRDIMDTSSCPVRTCPVYCCHFTEATVCHGLTIGAWKLHSIRAYLKERGLDPGEFIDRLPFHGEEHLRSLVPPNFILKEGGDRFIFFPKRRDTFIDRDVLGDLPKGRDCQTLMWINEQARPCAFLQEKRCMIHDTGDEASLEACKQFLCLTGFVFVILDYLGIFEEAAIPDRPMAGLNRLAVESLLILSRSVYGNEKWIKIRRMIFDRVKAAAAADRAGNAQGLRQKVDEYKRLNTDYEKAAAVLTRRAAEEIRKLLGV